MRAAVYMQACQRTPSRKRLASSTIILFKDEICIDFNLMRTKTMRFTLSALCLFATVAIAGTAAAAAGGQSGTHMSTQGAAKSNAPTSSNRATGLDNAQKRMSATGASHEKATSHTK